MQFQELQANNIVFIKEYAYISNMHVESLLCKDSKRHPPLSDSAVSYNEWKSLYSQVWEEQYVFSVLQSVTFQKMTEGIWEKKKKAWECCFHLPASYAFLSISRVHSRILTGKTEKKPRENLQFSWQIVFNSSALSTDIGRNSIRNLSR
jgi:hypothetical protein